MLFAWLLVKMPLPRLNSVAATGRSKKGFTISLWARLLAAAAARSPRRALLFPVPAVAPCSLAFCRWILAPYPGESTVAAAAGCFLFPWQCPLNDPRGSQGCPVVSHSPRSLIIIAGPPSSFAIVTSRNHLKHTWISAAVSVRCLVRRDGVSLIAGPVCYPRPKRMVTQVH